MRSWRPKLSRKEFIAQYAERSTLVATEWGVYPPSMVTETCAESGFGVMIALPCCCDSEMCGGWGMVRLTSLEHHLQFCLPESVHGYDAWHGETIDPRTQEDPRSQR